MAVTADVAPVDAIDVDALVTAALRAPHVWLLVGDVSDGAAWGVPLRERLSGTGDV